MQTLLQLDIWLQCYEGFNNAKNNERKEFEHCFCQYLKNNIPDIRLIPLDHVTYVNVLIVCHGSHKFWYLLKIAL